MKHLYLLRHAKSSWRDESLPDLKRPLSKRGKRDAPIMGERLQRRAILPELMISSPAKRARKTARIIAKAIGYPKREIVFSDDIYAGGLKGLYKVLIGVEDDCASVMMVGHNEALSDFANDLIGTTDIFIPTCGVVCINFQVNMWQIITPASGTLLFYDFPKRA